MNARYEAGELTHEQQARSLNSLERALKTAEFISDDVPNAVTPEVQETRRAGWIIKRAPPGHGRQGSYEWQNFYVMTNTDQHHPANAML